MMGRAGLAVLIVALAAPAPAACPSTNGRDAAACDARPAQATIAACAQDAMRSERCADRATGIVHRMYVIRAMSEFTKAGVAAGARTTRGRQWLAHATVLAERIQDDPDASPAMRHFARDAEAKAKHALFGR